MQSIEYDSDTIGCCWHRPDVCDSRLPDGTAPDVLRRFSTVL